MSDLFNEIEADIRAERAGRMWKRFGKNMVWASVAIVAGTAGGVLWKSYSESINVKNTSVLASGIAQMQMANSKNATALFDKLSEQKNSVHYVIAMLHKADALSASGKADDSREVLKNLAIINGDDDTRPFIELAKLKLGEGEEAGTDSVFRLSLIESKAWKLLAKGEDSKAAMLFAKLDKDPDASASLRNRVTLALQTITPKTVKTEHE